MAVSSQVDFVSQICQYVNVHPFPDNVRVIFMYSAAKFYF